MNRVAYVALILLFFGLFFYVPVFFANSLCCSIQNAGEYKSVTELFQLGLLALMLWAVYGFTVGD